MFSRVSERKMLSVRSLLLVGWLTLIASLFWDPFSATLTDPNNLRSPFRISDAAVSVQHEELTSEPYPMGARIFWTMLVPILPLYLMVFGHEAWRRICPLSLASQIPGYLGLRRSRVSLDRRTGLVRRSVPLIDRQGWLARNSWYVQFGLLFTGVAVRLLVINTDRYAMGIVLLAVIAAAMLTGVLWGGKTWCNYFCPANVVQKIYTEPGGLLESKPHFSRPPLPQSMCRKPSSKGDISACVACTTNCGDIDLQRSYWTGIKEHGRRNVYYMFLGLVIGFYGYYYLYAGSWDYYFSGIWTHEDGIRRKLLSPGFYILGEIIPLPKLVAVPLTLGVTCAAALILGRGLEWVYRRLRSGEEGMTEEVILHHCLCISAWLSINAFYSFGGRPNMMLLPDYGEHLLDLAILALTTEWLRRVLHRSAALYQQESMASSLLTELKKLKVNVSELMGGRGLEKLKANEIFLLSKILPGYSQRQKRDAYRKILDEAVSSGSTASASALKMLNDFRTLMDISEEEHTKLLEELGFGGELSAAISIEEKQASLAHYRSIIGSALASRLESGLSIEEILMDPQLRSTVTVLRQSLQITDDEHKAVLHELSSQSGVVGATLDEVLDQLFRLRSLKHCLSASEISTPVAGALLQLLLDALKRQEEALCLKALSTLRNFQLDPDAYGQARDLASLWGSGLNEFLDRETPSLPGKRWRDIFSPSLLAILTRPQTGGALEQAQSGRRTERKAIIAGLDYQANFKELLANVDPVVRAIGLVIFSHIDKQLTRESSERILLDDASSSHPLLIATAERIAGIVTVEGGQDRVSVRAEIQYGGSAPDGSLTFEKDYITIGSDPGSDIVLPASMASPHHAAIRIANGSVRLVRLNGNAIAVDGQIMESESNALEKNSVLHLGDLQETDVKIAISWQFVADSKEAAFVHPMLRLGMIAHSGHWSGLPLADLANLAIASQVERWGKNAAFKQPDGEWQGVLVSSGEIQLFDSVTSSFVPGKMFRRGDLILAAAGTGTMIIPKVVSKSSTVIHVPVLEDKINKIYT